MTTALNRPVPVRRTGRYPNLPIEPAHWRAEGNCARSVLEFIPTVEIGGRVGTVTHPQRQRCTGCPVQRWCALSALKQVSELGTLDGVWAGEAASLTMRLPAFQNLLTKLGEIAGLDPDHYLLNAGRVERRRAHIAALSDTGYRTDEIARMLELCEGTVIRDLDQASHAHART